MTASGAPATSESMPGPASAVPEAMTFNYRLRPGRSTGTRCLDDAAFAPEPCVLPSGRCGYQDAKLCEGRPCVRLELNESGEISQR